jgi:branched-chain amino acid transport system permease protein
MQVLVNGIINGLPIAVLALAFTVVYLPTRIFYIALGAIYAAAPFVTWSFIQHGWPAPFAVMFALLSGVGLSLFCELINHWPLERKKAGLGTHILSSLGIYLMIVQAIVLIWGHQTKVLRMGLDAVFLVGDIVITGSQLLAIAVCAALLVIFYAWLRFTNLGLRFRALAENPTEFALRGYSVQQTRLLAFGVSGFLAAASALVVSYELGFDPNGGLRALLLAVVAMIMGGRLSFAGAALGGMLLGIIRSEVGWYFSSRWLEAFTFLLLTAFLFLRPNGILGRASRLEAET